MRKRKAETIPANTTMQQAIDMIKRLRAEKEALMVHLKESRCCSACARDGNVRITGTESEIEIYEKITRINGCWNCMLGDGESQFEFKGFSEEIYKGGRDA